jgi:exodeoxyribonuclease VII large subunit
LWAFNEEVVARAIFESALPVVSAVGHEIDFTISDFVADVRAATPSAGAEIITEDVFSSGQFLARAGARMRVLLRQGFAARQRELEAAGARLWRLHPRRRLDEGLQRLDDLLAGLQRCAGQGTRERRVAWGNLRERLLRVRPALVLARRRELVERQALRLRELALRAGKNRRQALAAAEGRLRLLGPEQVLARGYSITMDAVSARVIRAAAEVKPGQKLRTRLKSGEVRSVAEE